MSTVLKFDPSRRTTNADGTGYLVCECGNAYFELVRVDADGNERPGAVTLNPNGTAAGYAGTPRCTSCGRDKPL